MSETRLRVHNLMGELTVKNNGKIGRQVWCSGNKGDQLLLALTEQLEFFQLKQLSIEEQHLRHKSKKEHDVTN